MWVAPSWPAARIPSNTSSRASTLTSTPTTFAPPAAHFSEINLPKPLAAPVTITTLSCRYFDMSLLIRRSVGRNDRLEFVGRGTMHDQRVGPVVEFLADPVHALLSRPGRRRLQPLVGNQCSDVFDLLGCGFVVDPSSDRRHHRVILKPLQHSGVPVIGLHQQVPVALKIGGETRNGFLQPQLFREMVANRGETGPHPYAVGVTTGLFGGGLHSSDAALQRLRREVGVQDNVIEH